jgi:hypothetical protein
VVVYPDDGIVLALDPATKTGFCIGRPREEPYLSTVDLGREFDQPADIYGRAIRWFEASFLVKPEARPALLVIEQPIRASWGKTNSKATEITQGLHAVFTGFAVSRKIPHIEAPIKTWRRYALGRGDLKREAAKIAAMRLCRTLHWNAPDDNAAEAGGIWLWGCATVAPMVVRRIEPLFTGAMR